MNEQQVRAMFLLADIPVVSLKQVPNGYWPDCADYKELREQSPWWLVDTGRGEIEIGDRKKVVEIDWCGMGIVFPFVDPRREEARGTDIHIVRDPNITTWETGSHAWGYGQAVSVLSSLRKTFERHDFLKYHWSENPVAEADKKKWFITAMKAHWATGIVDRVEVTISAANKTFALQEFYINYPKHRVSGINLEEEVRKVREDFLMAFPV